MTCTASGTATAGQYQNTATATASGDLPASHKKLQPLNSNVSDSDSSYYFGVAPEENPGIDLEKLTNNQDADLPPGPAIPVGDPVTWIYRLTNTGDVKLSDIVVTDDQGVSVSCPKTMLDPAESMDCTATGTAAQGQYQNLGSVTALSPSNRSASDTDPSHYLGQVSGPAIAIEKSTNGMDADSPPGPKIQVATAITWTYVVTNTGNVALTDVVVTDGQGVAVTCPQSTSAVGESMTCTASGVSAAGQYSNIGRVTASPPTGPDINGADSSHYFGGEPSAKEIDIEKFTNGMDADSPPGPTLEIGDPVAWTYVVTNTGGRRLTDVSVVDDQGVAVSCPMTTLEVGQSMTCTASGVAIEGQYTNTATAMGTTPASVLTMGTTPASTIVQESDSSNYLGGGVDPTEEDGAPNSGDGNGDGVADSSQNHVASVRSSTGDYMTAVFDSPCTIMRVDVVNPVSLPPDPASGARPQGLLGFDLVLGPGCSSPVTVTVYYHGESDLSLAFYRKYGPTPDDPSPHWYTLPATFTTVSIGGATPVACATFSVTDGGLGGQQRDRPGRNHLGSGRSRSPPGARACQHSYSV